MTHTREQIEQAYDAYIHGDNSHRDVIKAVLREAIDGGWQDISTAPKDGTILDGGRSIRYLPYKPQGRKQMMKNGRWQEFNGYGWDNCKDEPTHWRKSPPNEETK